MGFLDRFRKQREPKRESAAVSPWRDPSRSQIDEHDLRTVDDIARRYPLPVGFTYRQREQGAFVIVREQDQATFLFLIEEGILSFEEPYSTDDGSVRHKTREVLRMPGA